MSEGNPAKLPWNDRHRRWRVRWWHVLIAFVVLTLIQEAYFSYRLSHFQQGEPPSAENRGLD